MANKIEKKYGLSAALSMVIGIVIGSGIFFRPDRIMNAVDGNLIAAVIAWVLGGAFIIFGGWAISLYATREDAQDGLLAYCKIAFGDMFAKIVGYFFAYVAFPTLIAILGYVAADFTLQLFLDSAATNANFYFGAQTVIALIYIVGLYIMNVRKPQLGGVFQQGATIVKIIPLLVLGAIGLFFAAAFGGVGAELGAITAGEINATGSLIVDGAPQATSMMGYVLLALPSVAFAYDSWIVATSIAGETKNAERNLPIALVGGGLFIMVIYLFFFVGVNNFLGVDFVVENARAGGNYAVYIMAGQIHPVLAVLTNVAIVISVLGGCNGMTIGMMRYPYYLVQLGLMEDKGRNFGELNEANVPENGAKHVRGFIFAWIAVYVVTQLIAINGTGEIANIAGGLDLGDVPLLGNYAFFLVLYVGIIKLAFAGEIAIFKGIILALVASLGSIVIIWAMITIPFWGIVYAILPIVIAIVAFKDGLPNKK